MMNRLKQLIESNIFQNFILSIIILNAILIGLDTSVYMRSHYSKIMEIIDTLFLIIFSVEIVLRLITYRQNFFKKGWNIFDFLIVLMALLPENGIFSVFRILRIIRVLRLVSVIPKMRLISQALFKTLSPMLGVGVLLMILFYIYAVITTNLYGEKFPQWFGTLGESFYSLFQIMTFESWSMGIVRPVMEQYPNAWLVFVSFLMIASYIVLNIAIGIIVDCIGEIKNDQNNLQEEKLQTQIQSLENEIKQLKQILITQSQTKV